MARTTISIPDELLQRSRMIAAEQGSSIADLVREALEEKTRNYRPQPLSLGTGSSGHTGTAQRTGDERVGIVGEEDCVGN